ncbi:MAG TPA: hypothetical protein VGO71_08470 [Baekduia sp.]|jgi:hypothetical protein|nr:hypothetical protein [Baekduia sp.]
MPTLPQPRRIVAGVVLVALVSGVAASAAVTPPPPPAGVASAAAVTTASTTAATPPVTPASTMAATAAATAAAKTPATAVDRLTATAKQRWNTETHGGVAFATLHRVGRDPGLRQALASGSPAAVRAYVNRVFPSTWYHWHVSRVRIVKGSKILVDAGVPFVVAPAQMTLKSSTGRTLGRLQISIQDVIGFVRYMHRNYPLDVVVRGQGAAHVRSSLPAATNATLPSSGSVTISGRRYQVRSFHEAALGAEPVTVWILAKG